VRYLLLVLSLLLHRDPVLLISIAWWCVHRLGIQCFCRLEAAHPAIKGLNLKNRGSPSKLRMLLAESSMDPPPCALSHSLLLLPSPEGVLFVAVDVKFLLLLSSTSFISACSQEPQSVVVNRARHATLLARSGLHPLMGVWPRGRQHMCSSYILR
jgi:hypothetical protein